ncbi:MAG: hypothetical protein ACLFNN_00390 [Candidatus Paceibacterota bacterium]
MSKLFTHNAYRILGLDSTAETKDVLRRSKEIEHRLNIGDFPEYDFDINTSKEMRTKEAAREAVQKIQNPKKKIKENFFWFRIVDDVDNEAIKLASRGDYHNAIRVWQNASEGTAAKTLFYKKNLAILLNLILLNEDSKGHLRDSIAIWNDLVNSNKFWTQFIKDYETRDDAANRDFILDFKSEVAKYLSDFYADLHELHNDSEYIKEFQNVFSARGEKIEKAILNPAFQTINAVVESLESMKVSEDGILDKDERVRIKELIDSLRVELNNLIKLGLYEDSQTKVMRDRAASAIRIIVFDLHDNLSETDKAISLMEIAQTIVGTSGLESKIKHDIKVLEETKKNANLVQPVADLIEDEKYEEALTRIESDRKEHGENQELQEFYDSQKKLCITALAIKKYQAARSQFDNKQEASAKPLFEEAGKLIYDNLDLFSFKKEGVEEIIEEIKSNVSKANLDNLEQFDNYRNSFVQAAKKNFEGQLEETAFIILIDSYIWGGLTDVMGGIRRKTNVVNVLYTLGWLTIWFYGIGLIFFIAGWVYKQSNN